MRILSTSKIADQRHPIWVKYSQWWRWLAHSYEGGQVYRDASYGTRTFASLGMGSCEVMARSCQSMNLWRYKTEVPDYDRGAGEHPDYALRLARTPVPTYVADAIDAHLSEVYSQEIKRGHEDDNLQGLLVDWWSDIDGCNTSADEWFPEVVMPYLLAVGCLDLQFDRPASPDGESVVTMADVDRLRLDRCVAAIVFPWNVLDWKLIKGTSNYEWVVNLEAGGHDSGDRREAWRLRRWDADGWTLYDGNSEVVEQGDHTYQCVPQFRACDRPNPRVGHLGRARYEAIAEIQREAYNKESEIILSNARHSYPVAQAPKSMMRDQDGGEVPITPDRVLVMGDGPSGEPQGLEYVDVPQGPSDSLRKDVDRCRDQVDRAARLTKPAGVSGTGGNTVAQSGISKLVDAKPGKELAAQLSRTGYKTEWEASRMVLCVLFGRKLTDDERDGIQIVYPKDFDLIGTDDWTGLVLDYYATLDRTGTLSEVDVPILQRYARLILPGRDDEGYRPIDLAIERFVMDAVDRKVSASQAIEEARSRLAGATAEDGDQDQDQDQDTGAEATQPDVEPAKRGMIGRLKDTFKRRQS